MLPTLWGRIQTRVLVLGILGSLRIGTEMWNYLPFNVGFPGLDVFMLAVPTAVIAQSDLLAVGAIRAAEARGAWDARLESVAVDSMLHDSPADAASRAGTAGWRGTGPVVTIAARTSLDAMAACFHSVTVEPARILGLEGYGIEPGCRADLVVLEEDPLRVEPDDLADIPISSTWVGGEITYGEER